MENAVVEAEADLSDDPFDSSDDEDEQNDDVLRVLSRQSNTAVVIKPELDSICLEETQCTSSLGV